MQDPMAYLTIGFMLGVATLFALTPLVLARFLAPRQPNPIKSAAYECGVESKGEIQIPLHVGYYLYALVFLIFDIEVIFLYAWAKAFTQVGWSGFCVMALFLLILAESLVYLWLKGALVWKR